MEEHCVSSGSIYLYNWHMSNIADTVWGGTNGSINEVFMKNMANSVCSYSKHNAGYSSDVLKR